jgi:hypothetical protein
MNDPHVEALHYRVTHADCVDFKKASPLEHEETGFSVRIEDNRAKIVMKDHHPTTELARDAIEPFLRAWEVKSTLDFGDKFEFLFAHADIIDRRPTRGVYAQVIESTTSFDIVHAHVSRARYPEPPVGWGYDSNVGLMHTCYRMYREGRSRLGDTAYFCLTVLEHAAGDRRRAAHHFAIALPVLNKLGELTAEKGGMDARKAKGAQKEFTSAERIWLEETLKTIIRRASEVAYDSRARPGQITMADLPLA